MWNYTRNGWKRCETKLEASQKKFQIGVIDRYRGLGLGSKILKQGKTTLKTSGEDVKTKLKTSGEDQNLHSKLVAKIRIYTPNECRRFQVLIVFECISPWSNVSTYMSLSTINRRSRCTRTKVIFYTRFECNLTSSPLDSSVVSPTSGHFAQLDP